jgi:hypothetical protein
LCDSYSHRLPAFYHIVLDVECPAAPLYLNGQSNPSVFGWLFIPNVAAQCTIGYKWSDRPLPPAWLMAFMHE